MSPDDVIAAIDPKEVVDLALALGNIDSPTGSEGPAGQFVFDWLERSGFQPRKYALVEDRFSVAAWIEGTGGGYSLIYNAHLDTTLMPDAVWSALREVMDPEFPISLVDLGLIYEVRRVGTCVEIDLTFTATACPCMDFIHEDIRERLLKLDNISEVKITHVWDPPWTVDRISEAGKKALKKCGVAA